VGGIKAAVAPVVHAAVDTTDGPGRGQTVCDLRGLYMDYPEQPGARCRVVLSLEGEFAPHLVERLLGLAVAPLSGAVPAPA
jgi:purine nucleosidase